MCQGRAALAPDPSRLQLCRHLRRLERGPKLASACRFGYTLGALLLCERTYLLGTRKLGDPTVRIAPHGEAESDTTSSVSTSGS
jgi:hypothetical protein